MSAAPHSSDKHVLGSVELGRGFAWAAGARIGAYAAALLSGPLLARMLTPDELGDYFLAMTVATVGSMVALMGLSGVALREVSSAIGIGRPDRARSAITGTVLLACVGGILAAALLVSPVGRLLAKDVLHSPHLGTLMPLVAAWTVLLMAGILAASIWRGLGNVRLAVVLGDFGPRATFAAGLAVLWVAARHVDVEGILWLWVGVSAALVAVWAVVLARRVSGFPTGSRPAHRAFVGAGLAMLVSAVMWQAMDQIDLVILANAAPRHDVALYGAAARISLLLSVPLFLVEFVVAPLIGALNARGETSAIQPLLRRTATIAMVPTAIGAIAVLAAGRWILEGLYGSYYGQAWPVLAVLAVGDLVFVLTGSCGLALWMMGQQRLTAKVATTFAVVTLGAAVATAHAFGMLGLAVTMVIGIVAQNAVLLVLARRRLGIWTHAYMRPKAVADAVVSVVRTPDAHNALAT
jgi:O-antigen/teichoic acid export membrane protein